MLTIFAFRLDDSLLTQNNMSQTIVSSAENFLQHTIPDKSIADCVEALIGAYLISGGQQGALMFMTW